MNQLHFLIEKLFSRGFFHIFGSNVLNKIFAFLTNIAIVWFMAKEDYGIFSYANSIYALVMLLTGFGLLSGMFQFCLEERSDRERLGIYRYALTRGLVVDCFLALVLIGVGLFVPLPIDHASFYLLMFSPMVLLDYLFQYVSMALRIAKKNRAYARLQTMNTILYMFLGCGGAFFGGITGTIAGRLVAYGVCICLGGYFLGGSFVASLLGKANLSVFLKRDLWQYSVPTQISAGINQLTYLLDILLVGYFIADATSVANYKVGTMFPEGLLVIPQSLIVFVLPYFVEKNQNGLWFKVAARKLISFSAVGYLMLSLILFFCAQHIVILLWGEMYLDAVAVFRILAISFFFGALRTTCSNLLCALRAVRSNLVVSSIALAINLLLCLALIPRFGINGAALAPMVVAAVSAALTMAILWNRIESIRSKGE